MKPKIRRKMKKNYTVRRTAFAQFLGTLPGKIALRVVIGAGIAGLLCVLIFVVVPAVAKAVNPPEKVPIKLNDFKDSLDTEVSDDAQTDSSVSYLQKEAVISTSRVNDPYIYENEIVFSSAEVIGGTVRYAKMYIYNTDAQTTEEVRGITMKYDNLISMRMNQDFIVFLDSADTGGGRICVYDRRTGKQTAIKDYLYAAPQISLEGSLIAFMQQAGDNLDRLYLFDLETFESTAYRVFSGLPAIPSAVSMQNGVMVYAIPYQTEDGYNRSRIYTMNLATGEEKINEPGKLAQDIRTNGTDIAFLSSVSGAATELYLLDGVTPMLVDSDVANFEMGESYIVYTKGEDIYLYFMEQKQTRKLNSDISRGRLVNATGNMICWYDVTSGYDRSADIVRYAEVQF